MAAVPEHRTAHRDQAPVADDLRCPTCSADLAAVDDGSGTCEEGHRFTAVALALATNRGSVRALWSAIRALEDDAAGLDYLAGRAHEPRAADRKQEAQEAREAALRLRAYANAAQRRLDALDEAAG